MIRCCQLARLSIRKEAADLPSLLALPDSPGKGIFYEATRRFVESGNAVIRLWKKTNPRLPSPSTLSNPTAVPEADERHTVCARLA